MGKDWIFYEYAIVGHYKSEENLEYLVKKLRPKYHTQVRKRDGMIFLKIAKKEKKIKRR